MSRRRRSGTRTPRPVMRIFTEGAKTEINYVRGYVSAYLANRGYTCHDIVLEQPTDYSPTGLFAAAQQDGLEGDVVWIVFDCDRHPDKGGVFRCAAEQGVKIAYSSISFETWILLHFCYSTRAFASCAELVRVLERYFPKGYDKAKSNLFEETAGPRAERLPTAIANAKRLVREVTAVNPGRPLQDLNPYTNVHELLEAIDSFVGRHHSRL